MACHGHSHAYLAPKANILSPIDPKNSFGSLNLACILATLLIFNRRSDECCVDFSAVMLALLYYHIIIVALSRA